MNSGSSKRSREVIPSYSSGKPVVARTGALIGRPVEQPRSYERITRAKYEDKQTGSYERYTTKEKASSGERHVERGSRQVGVRDEYKKSSSVKVTAFDWLNAIGAYNNIVLSPHQILGSATGPIMRG